MVLEKIRSEELRSAAMTDAAEPRTVIVEVGEPMPRLTEIAPTGPRLRERPRFRFAEPALASAASRIQETREEITGITGVPPETYLPTSASFIVSASGAQIGRIAQVSGVAAIWPNSRRSVR